MCLFAEPGIFSLYVAVSRLTTREGLKILAEGARSIPTNTTTNIVYNEIIHSLQETVILVVTSTFIRPVVLTFCSTCVCEKTLYILPCGQFILRLYI